MNAAVRRQHITLVLLTLVATGLILYFVSTRVFGPRHNMESRLITASIQERDYLRNQLAARQGMDLPALQRKIDDAYVTLRTLKIGAHEEGPAFIDSRSPGNLAAFQALISRRAAESRLAIEKHSSISNTEARLDDMVVRELDLRGRFGDIQTFVDSLKSLPHRVVILSFELTRDIDRPGQLRALLRYSL